jgi:PAS domain S-box-containing protein
MKKIPLPADIVSEILNASPDATIVSDADGSIRVANQAAAALFGYGPDELIGKPIEILVPDVHRARHEELRTAYHKAPRGRPMVSGLEIHARHKDGHTFRAEVGLLPIETDDGLVVTSTIRPAKTAEDSEAYFRNLLESAPDAMVIVDDKGKIAVVNEQAERMFGYERGQILGQKIETLLPYRIHDRHRAHREEFMAEPKLRPMGEGMDLVAKRKDGSEFPVEISLSPVSADGRKFVSSVIRDVTERKRMEDEIIAAQREAERANKANSAFLAAASHDLRQPVQALSLLNGALRRTVKDERALQMIDSQQHSLTAMTNLLNSLLDISRLDAGAISPELEEFPIRRLIDRLSDEFARQAQHKGLGFSAFASDGFVRSDPNLLAEVIQNLVSNAIRYTEKGSVTLRSVEADGHCRIEVEDTGIGIDDDDLGKIFSEFHQCKTPGASKEGFGLGLAIVKRLGDLLQLDIDVESRVGRGSCFSITLPVVQSAEVSGDESGHDVTSADVPYSGLIVLIEDDFNVANAWGLLLEAEGFRVAMAESAPEASALIRHLDEMPQLLISDFHLLDGSTGVEAVSDIRDYFDKDIPAFIVSGDTSKIVKESRLLDNCTLMSKPVDTNRLLAAARHAVRTATVPQD